MATKSQERTHTRAAHVANLEHAQLTIKAAGSCAHRDWFNVNCQRQRLAHQDSLLGTDSLSLTAETTVDSGDQEGVTEAEP